MNDLTGDKLPSPRADPEIIREEDSTFVPRVKVPGGSGKVNLQRRGPDRSPTAKAAAILMLVAEACLATITTAVMRADGTGLHRITRPLLQAFWPGWSPDGRRIVFTDDCCQFGSNFWTVRPHGTGLRQLTHFGPAPLQGGFASYSPDGRRIVLQYNGNARWAESAHRRTVAESRFPQARR